MAYEDEMEEEETCLDIIDAEFIKRYPITVSYTHLTLPTIYSV